MGSIKFKHSFKLGETCISDFLTAVKRHATLHEASDKEAILLMLSSFKDVAESNLIQDGLTEAEMTNWDLFSDRIITRFGMTENEWFSKFEGYSRTENDSCAQLLNKLTLYFRNALGKKV